ncbi:hypothetical protein M2232_003044 [Bradyrhizobium japonicum]|uniref:hypothetical protein n=1 Tax=Bradyrhizobium japonicum TaxID=375 RepID=UPI002225ED41|nr:hypothetical protein [Bradyrhizobium japonicum]MCW2219512.1 hypothetical protein [Bradyrhizobium japonicum]MCW2344126.1 hypothetical protein [Bradyrhizobium japonicum]
MTMRSPGVRQKLEAAQAELAALDAEVAALTLDDTEDKPGARKALTAHRSNIQAAERRVDELKRALALAEKLDRQAAATGAVRMRDEQFTALKQQFSAREKAAETVMKAVADLSAAYGKFSECSLNIASVMPSGTVLPTMSIGPNGIYGPALGPCGQLILAELWRIAPERRDGAGRYVMPFVRPGLELMKDVAELPAGIDELRTADQAIIANISQQVEHLNEAVMRAADMIEDTAPAADVPLSRPFGEALVEMAHSLPQDPSEAAVYDRSRQTLSLGDALAAVGMADTAPVAKPSQPPPPASAAFAMSDADAIAGMSFEDCAKACGEAGCALTGGPRCSHPLKGGLTKSDLLRPEIVSRYAAACAATGMKNIHAPAEVAA